MNQPPYPDGVVIIPEEGWTIANNGQAMDIPGVEGASRVSAQDITKYISRLAFARGVLLPELPRRCEDARDEQVYAADAWEFKEMFDEKRLSVRLRAPGLGWVVMNISAELLREMALGVFNMIGVEEPDIPVQ